jgi:predicted Rossmann fold nucleotide-binding protein DprA/Smf involved in DNA uptake
MSATFVGVGSRAASVRYPRADRPLTALQAEVLEALTDVPAWPKAVAARCSLSERQVHTGVYALSAKGLAVRTAGGWRRVA